jgi:hypothetical protein
MAELLSRILKLFRQDHFLGLNFRMPFEWIYFKSILLIVIKYTFIGERVIKNSLAVLYGNKCTIHNVKIPSKI